jgi:hypothetical protein
MAKDQGQTTLPDAAEAQHDNTAGEIDMPAVIAHIILPDGAPSSAPVNLCDS